MAKGPTESDLFGGMESTVVREKKISSTIDGFKGVDAAVPKTVEHKGDDGIPVLTREMVPKPAPRGDKLRAVTTGGKNCSETLARARNRYKLMNSAFHFSPLDDKEIWEKRRDIAFHEMQAIAFQEKLDRYTKTADPVRPEQVRLLQQYVDMHKGTWLRLIGQEAAGAGSEAYSVLREG